VTDAELVAHLLDKNKPTADRGLHKIDPAKAKRIVDLLAKYLPMLIELAG
jgi:FtsZ-interacting cell division protein YlmF